MCKFLGVQSVLIYHPLIHTRLVFNLAQNDDSSQVRAIEKRKPLDTLFLQNRGAYEIPTDRHLPPLWVVASLWGLRAKQPVLHIPQNRRCCLTLSIGKTTIFLRQVEQHEDGENKTPIG